MTIAEMNRRVQRLNLRTEVPKLIEATGRQIIEYNQEQLYKYSIGSDNQPLRLYGSAAYSLYKERKNPSPGFGRPDLYDTGAFYRGFRVYAGYTGIWRVTSVDSKTPKLESKYGTTIFGLTPNNRGRYIAATLRPRIQEYITRVTSLRFS